MEDKFHPDEQYFVVSLKTMQESQLKPEREYDQPYVVGVAEMERKQSAN